ncbi:Cation/H(+) antiporter 10 [Platanthera guangdongensis]|uniref:Cation/H(+) antiporter 10 n=1 Tax=Platanthera guangdongensis TaxID=2320717 RepID=A0ABR2LN14_9ASPA
MRFMICHYSQVVLAVVIVGSGSASLIRHIYRPEDRFVAYKRRVVQFLKRDSELRILTCIHSEEHVNAVLTLLKIMRPPTVAPICLYPIHLKPLFGHAATLPHPYTCHCTPYDAPSSDTDRIFNAIFQAEQLSSVDCSILPYVCISPYATMHEGICSLALDKKRFRHHEALLDRTEERLDEMMLEDVRMRWVGGSKVVYREEVVKDAEEIIEVIREVSGGVYFVAGGKRWREGDAIDVGIVGLERVSSVGDYRGFVGLNGFWEQGVDISGTEAKVGGRR